MIARAHEARVIAIDIDPAALELAMAAGAETAIDASTTDDVAAAVRELAEGGANLSVDALGSRETCFNSIACLAKRGRHVQVGLMAGDDYRPQIPMELVIANELEILGSHGMQAHAYGRMLDMMVAGKLDPGLLIKQTVDLERAAAALGDPGALHVAGVTVIDRFGD
jgi:alcohol dehydrogenase